MSDLLAQRRWFGLLGPVVRKLKGWAYRVVCGCWGVFSLVGCSIDFSANQSTQLSVCHVHGAKFVIVAVAAGRS